jgi:hypothetical protein
VEDSVDESGEAAFVEGDDFLEALLELGWLGGGIGDAMADVVFEELGFEAAEGGVDGVDGVEDFRTLAVFLDHAADALDLACDLFDAAGEGCGLLASALHEDTHGGYRGFFKRGLIAEEIFRSLSGVFAFS